MSEQNRDELIARLTDSDEPFMVFCGPFAEAWFEFIAVHDAAIRKAALTEAADAIREHADCLKSDLPGHLARVVEGLIGGEE